MASRKKSPGGAVQANDSVVGLRPEGRGITAQWIKPIQRQKPDAPTHDENADNQGAAESDDDAS